MTHFVDTVLKFQNHDPWHGDIYYLGQKVSVTSGAAIPWHCLLVWIVITTPVLYIICFLVECLYYLISLIKNFRQTFISDATPLLCIVRVIIAAVIIKKPIFYNGWRHFYFIYPFIVLLSVYGVKNIFNSCTYDEMQKLYNPKNANVVFVHIFIVDRFLDD